MWSHSYVWQRIFISALRVQPHKNRHHKRKKENKRKQYTSEHGIVERFWWRAYAKNLWSSKVCAMKTWTWMQFPIYRSRSIMFSETQCTITNAVDFIWKTNNANTNLNFIYIFLVIFYFKIYIYLYKIQKHSKTKLLLNSILYYLNFVILNLTLKR